MLSREAPAIAHPNRASGTRRAASGGFAAIAVIAATVLSGCGSSAGGFQPLYGNSGTGAESQTYDQRLATVEIANIPGRVGQRLRNELVFERSTGTQAVSPERRLDIIITETLLTTLVNSTGASSSQVYQLEARYQLIDLQTKKKIFEGRSLGRGSFDRFDSIYSNLRARQDAENRVAKSVADEIRTRLLAFLSRPS